MPQRRVKSQKRATLGARVQRSKKMQKGTKLRRRAKRVLQRDSLLAAFVRQRRKRLGYTQTQFAWRVGVGLG